MKSEWSNYIPMEGVNRAMSTRINCHHGRDRLAQEKKKYVRTGFIHIALSWMKMPE